jgi:uncharacterized membrane protein
MSAFTRGRPLMSATVSVVVAVLTVAAATAVGLALSMRPRAGGALVGHG